MSNLEVFLQTWISSENSVQLKMQITVSIEKSDQLDQHQNQRDTQEEHGTERTIYTTGNKQNFQLHLQYRMNTV